MSTPQLVKDHSESDVRVDPTNPQHIIGTSKWFVSAEGYNHLMGFYESFDGGKTWPVQGHVPGYEGWTDNTDPVGAFDTYGNYYFFDLAYQFFYNKDGGHNFTVGRSQEPNPAQPAEIVGVAVRPHGAKTARQWSSTVNGKPDIIASYDSVGNEPDKQWITIDTSTSPTSHTNRIYAMWVNFHFVTPVPCVSYADALPGGTHTPWSTPQALPEPPHTATGATYLLPHVAPNGDVYTTVTNFDPAHGYCCASIFVDKSTDGGKRGRRSARRSTSTRCRRSSTRIRPSVTGSRIRSRSAISLTRRAATRCMSPTRTTAPASPTSCCQRHTTVEQPGRSRYRSTTTAA
jgi:hypothetical protein